MNKRLGIETIVVTFVWVLVLLGWNVVQGMLATFKHAPKITQLHPSGAVSRVEFGSVTTPDVLMITLGAVSALLFAVIYYAARSWQLKKRNRTS
ncbi:putative integral membrane protein [Paenibacillus sp. JGP012]|uniref:hypothetical protein n=1 Tax=Paenibacillus sp. JGP012 TaxID=2735914 RepID=UPI001613557B|nr:hypothetical protein [Paenibacillus sp. JGP012]MBB6021197.1 putative integral membrane protein [Paenibacillus sp. JGP012]